uniref:FAD/NAD(P)-binding domain-containing protein n=1 Tax=Ditylum brightwellii TaxID=49249 RepID=A0A7S4VZP3_9STRA|mmetsp:Transcript_29228/g.38980  ORF Transcript_29228/g.38980 Transcript_29228/m.38980 type:complete len:408 (-) Transcript_29228:1654-2877(-)
MNIKTITTCVFLLTLEATAHATSLFDSGIDDVPTEEKDEENMYATFFDRVVIPARESVRRNALGEAITVSESDAATIKSGAAGQCSEDALTVRILEADRKLVIVGGGPAGLSAAVYAARAGLSPLIIARDGGQLEGTSDVHNYPGFDEGVDAVDLIQRLERQAERFGADRKECGVRDVDLTCRPFKVYCEDGEVITSSAVVIATGASPRWIGAEGEQELISKGVHTCATCDGYFYRGKHAVVIGGGDTAMEQALFLARLASRVTLIHRGGVLRASKAMATRVLKHPNILILWNTSVKRFVADGSTGALSSLDIETLTTMGENATSNLAVDGAFVAIGHTPNSEKFRGVRTDSKGYIYTLPGSTVTSVTGVFAAGDVQDDLYRQAITSAGTGAMAAMDAERWLCEHGC